MIKFNSPGIGTRISIRYGDFPYPSLQLANHFGCRYNFTLIEIEIERGEPRSPTTSLSGGDWRPSNLLICLSFEMEPGKAFHAIATQLAKRKTEWTSLSAALHQPDILSIFTYARPVSTLLRQIDLYLGGGLMKINALGLAHNQ